MQKQDILDNIEEYSAEDLLPLVQQGVVTFNELCNETEGMFNPFVRHQLQQLLADNEDTDWEKAKNGLSRQLLENYLRSYPDGKHREEARCKIKEFDTKLQEETMSEAWENVDKSSKVELEEFIAKNHNHKQIDEARRLLNELKNKPRTKPGLRKLFRNIDNLRYDKSINSVLDKTVELIKEYLDKQLITKDQLLNAINDDPNILSSHVIRQLVDDQYLFYTDIESLDIDEDFIEFFEDDSSTDNDIESPVSLERISKTGTEIYFWGVPASGKSCALGAILSVANNGKVALSMSKDNNCQGYQYMTRLAGLFRKVDTVCTLPPSTAISDTFEMGFDLEDQEHKMHSFICIDLAGELMKCMYKKDAKLKLSTLDEQVLKTVSNILVDNRTGNKKIHFFVLEYEKNEHKNEGLYQEDWLQGALRYIESTGILKNDTVGIYILITKADKTQAKGQEMQNILKEYIKDNYLSFYNGLKKIVSNNEIMDGQVPIIPFSLGEFCFQDYCLFDDSSAVNVVKQLLNRTQGEKNNKFGKLKDLLRS